MSVPRAPISPRHLALQPGIVPDRRRHKRYPLALLGRFMRASKEEYPCKLNDLSVGGAAMMSPVAVEIGERIIAYFDHIGGIEGTVVRVFDGGFAMRLVATLHKREKLAAQMTWLINKEEFNGTEDRRHDRVAATNKASTLRLTDGISVDCRILDVSLSGASLGTEARPPIGSEAMLGKLRCRVMRHHERGIGVQFLDIQEPEALRRYFG
ncbi:MAG TPA: PilZ domain-containing protein [Hyphomicrobiaceae bacterium]|nr:PilZ domain-containing protein [Hyphomicrobiaceae bacterium]